MGGYLLFSDAYSPPEPQEGQPVLAWSLLNNQKPLFLKALLKKRSISGWDLWLSTLQLRGSSFLSTEQRCNLGVGLGRWPSFIGLQLTAIHLLTEVPVGAGEYPSSCEQAFTYLPSLHPIIHLPIHLSIHPSDSSIHLCIHESIYPPTSPPLSIHSIAPFIQPYIYPFIYPFTKPIHPSVHSSVHASIYTSISSLINPFI